MSTAENTKLQEVISKIRKLQALAGNNSSTNEMKAATAVADRLMQEYRITQAQLEASGSGGIDPMTSLQVHSGGRRINWNEILIRALCIHYGCVWYISKTHTLPGEKRKMGYTVIGRDSDCKIIEHMFSWLSETIDRLAKGYTKGMGLAYARSWYDGAADGIAHQLREMKEEAEVVLREKAETSSALVLLSARKDEAVRYQRSIISLGKSTHITGGRNSMARDTGFQVGKRITLTKAIT